jgi:hypothetical protein
MYKFSFGERGHIPIVASVTTLEKFIQRCNIGKASVRRVEVLKKFSEMAKMIPMPGEAQAQDQAPQPAPQAEGVHDEYETESEDGEMVDGERPAILAAQEEMVCGKRVREDLVESRNQMTQYAVSIKEANVELVQHVEMREKLVKTGSAEIEQLHERVKIRGMDLEQKQRELEQKREEIRLAAEQKQKELDQKQKELEQKREEIRLESEKMKMQLEYQRELRSLQVQPAPPAVQANDAPPVSGDDYVTVLMVYTMFKAQFHSLKKKQEKTFLCMAGKKAVSAYKSKYGIWPAQITDGSFEAVNKYPLDARDLVLDALRVSYREILGGGGQQSLSFV